MSAEPIVLEGTWEEIQSHSKELEGRKVRLIALSPENSEEPTLTPEAKKTLEWLEEWKRTPLTDEETQVLEEFEQFRKEHPIRFRIPFDEP